MAGGYLDQGLDNRRSGYTPDDTPLLSLGAEMGRGRTGPIAWLRPGVEIVLEIEALQLQQISDDYYDIYWIVEFMWGGHKRCLAVSLVNNAATSRCHWNWNALTSLWFPGGEFNYLGSSRLGESCSLNDAELPALNGDTVGRLKPVRTPLHGVFGCLEQGTVYNLHAPDSNDRLGWSRPKPRTRAIAITGIHEVIEQAPGQPQSFMRARFTKPRLVDRPF